MKDDIVLEGLIKQMILGFDNEKSRILRLDKNDEKC